MPKGQFPRQPKATHVINGHKMSKLKHDRILAFKAMLPQLDDKERLGAADALDTTVCTLRTWLELTGTTWVNLKRRGPYKRQS